MKNFFLAKPALTAAAVVGFLFVAPLPFMAYINRYHSEPFYSFLSSFPGIGELNFSPLFLLMWFPIGAFVAALLMLRKDVNGKQKMSTTNSIAIITILLIIFLVLFTMLG
ncbi:MAG: hypothetical protein A2W41_04530 [Candidatus Ryanbacteria bacterium RIFCSPHIGHO2_01_45_13]|uniref:Uncharacterized protein n=1 Tax=Candidatus Ryanbacteria bacterium RIFCSPHIGHO2_01_45_13 TaxID=1802112 RepID=A0A1G2FTR2_9BACT|nr:MAG: hypothetical protein A2W41_04530 [Candidatus Ryanbacteria bacterium RIFCSPHIGHO2_01_45_13]